MPWIHLHDAVRVIAHALDDARYAGPINVVAPEERTNREVAQAIGRALDRPAVLPAPAALLRVGLGESAEALLGSQRVQPQRLLELGFTFAFPALDAALADVAGADGIQMGALSAPPAAGSLASAEYLYRHQPRFELRTSAALNAPLEAAFRFFSNARNLGLITPASMAFRFDGPPAELADGVRLDYRIRVGPVPMRWRTHIVSWEPPRRFVDVQEHGPYHSWWHEHVFRADGDRTIVEDRVCYAPPLPGAAGNLVNQVVVAPMLRRIFAYRGDVIRRRFNEAS
jgi:ligand-binding SRPBCC domain-containing protein